jgi:hypothetical protein
VTDGGCTFRAAACLNVTDARIPECQPTSVDFRTSAARARPIPTTRSRPRTPRSSSQPSRPSASRSDRGRPSFRPAHRSRPPTVARSRSTCACRTPGAVGRRLLSAVRPTSPVARCRTASCSPARRTPPSAATA